MTVTDEPRPAGILRGTDLIAFARGRVLATVIWDRRALVVTVLAFAPVTIDPPRAAFQLAGGRRSHEVALRAGTVLFSLLAEADSGLASRFGGVGRASGWDEVLGLDLNHRPDGPPAIARARASMHGVVLPGVEDEMNDFLVADLAPADLSPSAPPT